MVCFRHEYIYGLYLAEALLRKILSQTLGGVSVSALYWKMIKNLISILNEISATKSATENNFNMNENL